MSYDDKGKVICILCGKSFNQITPQHLKKDHDMTMADFKKIYPNAELTSISYKAKQKFKNTNMFSENTKEDKIKTEVTVEEFSIDKIPKIDKTKKPQLTSIELENNLLKDVKEFIKKEQGEYPDPTNSIHKGKLNLLNHLIQDYPDVKNSYYVEKYSISGNLEYKLITDIAIPSLKIDIEFPKCFWHNSDYPKQIRDAKLKKDGWKILNVETVKPSIEDVKNLLNK